MRLNQLLRIYIDGVPLDLTSRLLPFSTRLNFGLLIHVYPYLDPGTGNIVIQLIVAGLLGSGILLRSIWRKIIPKKTKPEDSTTETESEDKSNNNGDGI